MKKINKLMTIWGIGAAAVLTATLLTAATYAWFTSNREVETDKVPSRTNSSDVTLELSRDPENWDDHDTSKLALIGSEEMPLDEDIILTPVTTSDLRTFLYSPATSSGFAEQYEHAPEEGMYYHDTFYVRAASEDVTAIDSKMALYLDSIKDVPTVGPVDGDILTATRLGLKFRKLSDKAEAKFETPVIMSLSDVNEGDGNTLIGGVLLEKGHVLTYDTESQRVVPAVDIAVPLTSVQISEEGGSAARPLVELVLNEVYVVDVYFYLEGCDPDCLSNRVGMQDATMNLAFFGVLS